MKTIFLMMVGVMAWAGSLQAQELDSEQMAALQVMSSYMDESTHTQGMVTPQQVQASYLGVAQILDTREEAQYEEGHLPGAVPMEWRQVLERRQEIATDKPVLLYCGTGALSAQAGFALRALGYSNVVIMRGGYHDWQKLMAGQ
ncbi:rhodanese-like domain-containing protein [Magnetococcus marinus]|nr:rhodanese-like domain-containing protein [Magnetococcus marinus]